MRTGNAMGLFNTVRLLCYNPQSDQHVDIKVQFKYGETWQYEYEVGAILKWGGTSLDVGNKDFKCVVADGALDSFSGELEALGVPEDFEVYIVNGKIEKVIPATGQFDFFKAQETFIVVLE